MRRKISIQIQLLSYLCASVLFALTVVVLSTSFSNRVIHNTNVLFDGNQHLAAFFSCVDTMDSAARGYLYSDKDEDLQAAKEATAQAIRELQDLKDGPYDDALLRRMDRLENMIQYYWMPADAFKSGEIGRYDAYAQMKYRHSLIVSVSSLYYKYLSDSLSDQASATQKIWNRRFRTLTLISIAVLAIGFILGAFISKNIYRPLMTMVENVKRIQHGTYQIMPIQTNTIELDVLYHAFQEMASHIEQNIDALQEQAKLKQQLLLKENENLKMRSLISEAQLKNLQAQINPHFLFNSLNMIAKTAYLNEDSATSIQIEKLSAFLRYALDKFDSTSTLHEEIESIQNYLFIQKERFGNRITFSVEIDDDVPNIKIPAVILQPLIENAIMHGIAAVTENAEVAIHAARLENNVLLTVEDNGVGIPPEELEQLQRRLREPYSPDSMGGAHSIGLSNVYYRLANYYGNDITFEIESEYQCGTIVSILIPLKEDI